MSGDACDRAHLVSRLEAWKEPVGVGRDFIWRTHYFVAFIPYISCHGTYYLCSFRHLEICW